MSTKQTEALKLAQELRAQIGQGVPDGWQLVPKEPTDAMIRAALHLDLSHMPGHDGPDRAAVYKAMLASAPPAPQDKRCPLCKYQHGHQIGCENNPVDIALKAQASVVVFCTYPKCQTTGMKCAGHCSQTSVVQQKPLTDEQQIAEALRKHGFALVKTATGYDVMKLGPCIDHNIGEKK